MSVWFQRLESSLVAVVTWIVSLLAPIPTAYAIYRSSLVYLAFPMWVALALAVVIEGLGLGVLYVAVMLYSYEQERTQRQPSARNHFYLSLGLGGVYLVLALVLVAVVDVAPVAAVVAKFLFPFLSLTAGCLWVLRADHARRLADIAEVKAERKAKQSKKRSGGVQRDGQGGSSETSRDAQDDVQGDDRRGGQVNVMDRVNETRRARRKRLLDELERLYRDSGGQLSATETARMLNIGRSTFYTYMGALERAGRLNGHGEVVR